MSEKIKCYGQSCTEITMNGKVLVIDPSYKTKKADIIMLTGSVFKPEIIDKISKKDTKIIAPRWLEEEEEYLKVKDVIKLMHNEETKIDDVDIKTIPAYDINNVFESSMKKLLGFLIKGEKEIYYSGNTNLVPEMNVINVDYAFIPVDSDYVDIFEALAIANIIKAETFVPISYDKDENSGLTSCVKFSLKCSCKVELFRNKSDLPDVKLLVEDEV
ncbi:MAG: MBL fold metallo-hydrolase [Nanobdellota archaeon]